MEERAISVGLALTVTFGVAAQWIAWRLRLPSILLLLLAGLLAGPITGLLDPDRLLGDVLFPGISLAVSVILFEGGLTLRFHEVGQVAGPVLRLVTVGALITAVLAALAAYLLLDFSPELSALLGAILSVTGPTVVGPLLRYIRPVGPAGSILKWEGILIDPVGAALAVLVFEAISAGRFTEPTLEIPLGVVKALATGAAFGAAGAVCLIVPLARRWVPDSLHSIFTLMMVVAAASAANSFYAESGLLTVTLMGVALANQRHAPVRHILEFGESLRELLLSMLFVLLAARVSFADLGGVSLEALGFLAVLVLVVRPLVVAVCTAGSGLPWNARALVAWMAPRGVVAAAVSSVFAHRLTDQGIYPHAHELMPVVFLVIVGTVALYGLTDRPLAIRLGLAHRDPQGVLILGAHPFGRALAAALRDLNFHVLLVDSNYRNAQEARLAGLPVWHGNILDEDALLEMDLAGIGRLLALTSNDEANSLAAVHMREVFGRSEVYQLPPEGGASGSGRSALPYDLRGRVLFGEALTFSELERRMEQGWTVKGTPLTERFGPREFVLEHGVDAVPLLVVTPPRRLRVATAAEPLRITPGTTLIALVPPRVHAPEA